MHEGAPPGYAWVPAIMIKITALDKIMALRCCFWKAWETSRFKMRTHGFLNRGVRHD